MTADDAVFEGLSLDRLHERRSAKWSMHAPDVLPSHYAEMDFAPAPAIRARLEAALAGGDLGYAHAERSRLGPVFAGFAARRWGWAVDPGAVVAVPDVMVGVAELLRALTEPGVGVVITTPLYPPFFSVIAETGRRVVEVPLLEAAERNRLPLDGIRAAFADGARVLLLCNPHNPTGYVASPQELATVAELAAEHGSVVLSDEIHAPLVLPGAEHVPFCSVSDTAAGHAIVLTSASKGWNLAGLKCGVAVAACDRLTRVLAGLPVDLRERVGHLGVLASEAAFADGEPWLDALLLYLDGTRKRLPALLADRLPGIRYAPGAATYLAWFDCRPLGLGDDPAAHFLNGGRVALSPGPDFGAPGRGFAG
jgi:cystathionine beta-lyase